MTLTAPEPLAAADETDGFGCGRESLDAWLGRRARKNQISGDSRTYVVCGGVRVVACYALASSAVDADRATRSRATSVLVSHADTGRAPEPTVGTYASAKRGAIAGR